MPSGLADDDEEQESDEDAATRRDHEVASESGPGDGRHDRRTQGHQGGGVVEQRLALEDRHDPAREADPPRDRRRRDGVGRCHDGTDREAGTPAEVGQQPVHEHGDAGGGEGDQPDRQQEDRPPVGVEVDEARLDRRGVEQWRQQPEQHDFRAQLDVGHERQERADDADRDEHEWRGQVELLADRGHDHHGDDHADEREDQSHRGHHAPEVASARILLVELATVVAADDGLDHLDAPVRVGEGVLELGAAVDPPVRRPAGGAQAGQVDVVRRPEELLEPVGVGGRPLLQGREDRAAVVVGHHDGQVRPRLVGAEEERRGVVQERHVADVGHRAGAPWPAQRGADRARDGAVDAGEAPVGQHEPALADRVRAGHQVEVADRVAGADDEQPTRRVGGVDDRRDVVRRELGLVADERVDARGQLAVRRTPLLEPAGIVGLRAYGGVLGVDREGARRPATGRGHRDHLDVLAREHPEHRPRQGGVPEDDGALDPLAQRRTEQQAIAADRVRARARPAARLGQQRPPGPLGQLSRRRPGVVPRHHHRPLPQRQQGWLRIRIVQSVSAPRHAVPEVPRTSWTIRIGDQRVVELDVQVDRAAGVPGGGEGVGVGVVEVGEGGGVAVEADLVGGLVGAGTAQPRGAVGGDRHEGDARVRGLEHGGVQVGRRRAGGRHDRDRAVRGPGQPQGEEPGRALVDAGVQPHPRVGSERERQRRVARARAEHRVGEPALDELVDQPGRQLR